MIVTTGRVKGGVISVDGSGLEEGQLVTIVAQQSEETATLTAEEEEELLLAIQQGEQGKMFEAEEVLKRIRRG